MRILFPFSAKKFLFLLLVVFSICVFSKTVFAAEQALDAVVAVVNTEVITTSQLDRQITITKQQMLSAGMPVPPASKLRQQVLNQLINSALQVQLAKKANLTIDDNQVDQAITEIAAKNNITLAQLQAKVAQQGMSFKNYRNEIHKEMLISELQQREIAPTITVSDQEITDMMNFLKSHPNALSSTAADPRAQYHVIDILVPLADDADADDIRQAQQQANDLYAKLQKSDNPNTLLSENDAVQVNDMGWRTLAQLPDLFAKNVQTLSSGQFSNPLRAPNGIHILKVAAVAGVNNNPMGFNPGLSQMVPQAQIQAIVIKKNPLLSDQQMQAHLQLLRSQIIESGDFASVAEMNSQDPNSASKGGDMGWVSPGTFPPQVDQAISQLKVEELSQPIATPAGFYIIKISAKRQIDDSKNALHDRARQLVYQRKYAEAVQNWLQKLRSQSYVNISSE